MLRFLRICIKHYQHQEMRKNNSKLNFTKNHRANWFSCGWLKISKCSISLAPLDECSKSKVKLLGLCYRSFRNITASCKSNHWFGCLKCNFKNLFPPSGVTLLFEQLPSWASKKKKIFSCPQENQLAQRFFVKFNLLYFFLIS